jgi:hypothetical protein
MAKINAESLLAVAKLSTDLADAENRELDKIQKHLEAGEELEALEGMRDFFRHHRKPPDREKPEYEDRESKSKRLGARA